MVNWRHKPRAHSAAWADVDALRRSLRVAARPSIYDDAAVSPQRIAVLIGALLLLALIVGSQFGYVGREVGLLAAGAAVLGFLVMSWVGARARATGPEGRREPGWWRRRGPADTKLIAIIAVPAIALGVFAGVAAIIKGAWLAGLLFLAAGGLLALAVRWWASKTH